METEFERDVREFLAKAPFNYRGVSKESLKLFCTALTHDSYSNEAANEPLPRRVQSYERLEFLGDAILEFIVCEVVYSETDLSEGDMTDFKQDKVANRMLSERILAHGLDIDGLMRVGGGHRTRDGRNVVEENMRADCFEAILGAIYLSYGMDEVRRVVREVALE